MRQATAAVGRPRESTKRRRLSPFDGFVALNTAALLGTTAYAYAAREWEFGLYALATLLPIVFLWRVLRRYTYPWWLLGLLQLAVIAHFAGGLLHVGGVWLYGYRVLGVLRFDKLVHFTNTGIAAVLVAWLFREARVQLREWDGFAVVMTATGFATIVEILEYTAVVLLPRTGVGDYHNNAQDLIANLLGAVAGWAVFRLLDLKNRSDTTPARPS